MSRPKAALRAPISDAVNASILLKSRRRCCLCAFWDFDSSQKDGQIAHIDHDPSNASETNLVFLCFRHHNQYDSKPSQGKGITSTEVRTSRDQLYRNNNWQLPVRVEITIAIDGDLASFSDEDRANVLDLIKQSLHYPADIRIVRMRQGSILITLQMPSDAALRLTKMLAEGKIEKINVLSVSIDQIDVSRKEYYPPFDFSDFNKLPVASSILDPREHEEAVRLAIAAFGLTREDALTNLFAVTALGIAERTRIARNIAASADSFLEKLRHIQRQLAFEERRDRSILIEACEHLVGVSKEFESLYEKAIDLRTYWGLFGEIAQFILSTIHECAMSCSFLVMSASVLDNQSGDAVARDRYSDVIDTIGKAIHSLDNPVAALNERAESYTTVLREVIKTPVHDPNLDL